MSPQPFRPARALARHIDHVFGERSSLAGASGQGSGEQARECAHRLPASLFAAPAPHKFVARTRECGPAAPWQSTRTFSFSLLCTTATAILAGAFVRITFGRQAAASSMALPHTPHATNHPLPRCVQATKGLCYERKCHSVLESPPPSRPPGASTSARCPPALMAPYGRREGGGGGGGGGARGGYTRREKLSHTRLSSFTLD